MAQRQNNAVSLNESLLLPTTGGLRLACKLWTVKGKPVNDHAVKVICWPGWLDNSGSFDCCAELLCRDYGFALCAVDPPGCGLSDWRAESAIYNDFEEVPMIADVADELGWEHLVLMGHSRGGGVCALAAGLLGERVRAFICVDSHFQLSGLWFEDMKATRPRAVKKMQNARHMAKKNLKRQARVFATLEEAIDANKNNPWFRKSEETARNIVRRHVRPCAGGFTFTHDVRTYGQTQYLHLSEEPLDDFLMSVTAPTMQMLDGTRWRYISQNQDHLLQRLMDRNKLFQSGVTVVQMDGKGHHFHSDAAREFVDIVGPFIVQQCARPIMIENGSTSSSSKQASPPAMPPPPAALSRL